MATVWSELVTRNAKYKIFPVYAKHRQSSMLLTIPANDLSMMLALEGIPVEKDVTVRLKI